MLALDSKLYRVPRWAFIKLEKGFLLYSDLTPTLFPITQNEKSALDVFPQSGILEDWIVLATNKFNADFAETLKYLHPLIHKMINAKFLALNKPLEYLDWKTQLVDNSNDGGSRTCYLSVTDNCNLRCLYCYNADEREHSICQGREALSDIEIFEFIDKLADNDFEYIVFTGGEPMLRKSIFTIVEYAKNKGLGTNLLSNGTAFTHKNVKQVVDLFDSITVSLDSSIESEHEATRGKGSWKRTIRGLDFLMSQSRHEIALRPVITDHNIDNLYLLPEFAYSRWNISSYQPTMYLPNSIKETKELALLPDVKKYAKGMDLFYRKLGNIPGGNADDPLKSISYGGKCGMAKSIFSISANGDVFPCQSLHFDELTMGNIRHQEIDELFKNGEALGIVGVSGLQIPECTDCPFLLLCGGGCRATTYKLYGNMTAFNELMCCYSKVGAENQLLRYYEYRKSLTN